MSDSIGFGRFVAQRAIEDAAQLERSTGKHEYFEALDSIIGAFVQASLSGTRVATIIRRRPLDEVRFDPSLTLPEQLRDTFLLGKQQARGAWFLLANDSVRVDGVNAPYYLRKHGRFASSGMAMSAGRLDMSGSPEALFAWAVLEPAFEILFRPFLLRGAGEELLSREQKKAEWGEAHRCYGLLGLRLDGALKPLSYGAGWSKLVGSERLELKLRLLDELSASVAPDIGLRLRMLLIQTLARRFYDGSSKRPATMRSVLKSKPYRQILAGVFRGDWMEFLAYLGEKPSAAESIATSLPKTNLYVEAAAKAETVARDKGLPVEEVNRMLAAFWAGANDLSPVSRRVTTIRAFWREYEQIHSRQASGMPSLWGFTDASRGCRLIDPPDALPELDPSLYEFGLYLRVLPLNLLDDIRALWGTTPSPKWPDRLITEPNAFGLMIEALGPAIRLWDGCALTPWFLCESGRSRTDMKGLAKYHEGDLEELSDMKCPVPSLLFDELISAEAGLGPPLPIPGPESPTKISVKGMTLEFSTSSGTRRSGFERLRDIVTRHRRAWATQYLDQYLRARWETEIRESATRYYQALEVKGKALTPSQVFKCGAEAADHWFAGSLRDLLGAFGESGPALNQYRRVLPVSAERFAEEVLKALGGKLTRWKDVAATIRGGEREEQDQEWRRYNELKQLALFGVHFVQCQEALGREPELKEFGGSRFESLRHLIPAQNTETAWVTYVAAVRNALAATPR